MDVGDLKNFNSEAKKIEEDATYSSKAHYETSRKCRRIYLWLCIPVSLQTNLDQELIPARKIFVRETSFTTSQLTHFTLHENVRFG